MSNLTNRQKRFFGLLATLLVASLVLVGAPTGTASANVSDAPASHAFTCHVWYNVQSASETYASIARRFGVQNARPSLSEIHHGDGLYAGKTLCVSWTMAPVAHTVRVISVKGDACRVADWSGSWSIPSGCTGHYVGERVRVLIRNGVFDSWGQ